MDILKKFRKLFIIIFIIILLELTVFNYRYYATQFSGLESRVIKLSSKNLIISEEDNLSINKTYQVLLDENVIGMKLNILQELADTEITIIPEFKDESNAYTYKTLEVISYRSQYKNREYIPLNPQGKCKEIVIELKCNSKYVLDSIEINTWYFEFNWLRVIMFILFASFVAYYKDINKFFEEHPVGKKVVYVLFIVLATAIYASWFTGYGEHYERTTWAEGMVSKDVYREFTKSLMQGKITLDFPEQYRIELSNLENYQDYSAREEAKTKYLYDGAFYKGNYYCYYGIIPVITVLLPIAIVTGVYCYSNTICLVYMVLLHIILLLVYLKLLKKFNIKFSFLLEFTIYVAMLLTMEVFLLCVEPNFYEAVDLCAIFWGLLAFWLILLLDNGRRTILKLTFIGISYGCMVLSRPIYIFYIIPIVIAIWKYLFKNRKIDVRNTIAFALPIFFMAIFQMLYNYARFENIFEFGQFYQITNNDTSTLKFELGMATDGMLSFLFNPPTIYRHLPFFRYNYAGVNTGNQIFTDHVLGLIWHPFLLILLAARNIIKNNKHIKKLKLFTIIILTIAFITLVITITVAGVIQRYLTLVLPALTLMSLIYWLIYISGSKNEETKRDRSKILKILCILSIVTTIPVFLVRLEIFTLGMFYERYIPFQTMKYNIQRSLEFYK